MSARESFLNPVIFIEIFRFNWSFYYDKFTTFFWKNVFIILELFLYITQANNKWKLNFQGSVTEI